MGAVKKHLKANLQTFATLEQLAQAAAGYVAHLSAQAIAERGCFTVALSGGSLPKILCPPLVAPPLVGPPLVGPPLAAEPLRGQVDWSSWRVFWADERCVPLADPDSNYRLAREYLFEQVDIPPGQIYPLDDTLNPAAAAATYQAKLAEVFQPPAGQRPRFDLILLGMGEDGHTASLFPHHPLLRETERWVAPIFDSPKPPPARITLTLPVINEARQVIFITAGAGKAGALAQVMRAEAINPLPAQMVQPAKGEVHWFVDEAAATGLAG